MERSDIFKKTRIAANLNNIWPKSDWWDLVTALICDRSSAPNYVILMDSLSIYQSLHNTTANTKPLQSYIWGVLDVGCTGAWADHKKSSSHFVKKNQDSNNRSWCIIRRKTRKWMNFKIKKFSMLITGCIHCILKQIH